MSFSHKLKRAMGAGGDGTLPEYGIREIFATLGASLREFRKYAWMTPLLVTGEAIIECIIPAFTALLINRLSQGGTLEEIAPFAAVLTLLAIASLVFGTAAGITCSIGATGFARNLRHDVFHKIQSFSFANIDRFSTSSLVTRLTTDITNVQQAYMMLIRVAVRSPLLALFSIVMAFISGGPVAVIYVIVAFALGFAIFKIVAKALPIFRGVFRQYDRLNDSVEENVAGIRVVKSYVREDHETAKFDRASDDLYRDFVHVERILAWNNPVMNMAVDVIYTFVVYFGSMAIVASRGQAMGVGQLSALITYGFSMLISLMMLSMVFVMITMADESSRRICEVLLEKPTLADPAEPVTEVRDGSIDFDHVSFRYSPTAPAYALSDIDLHIASGETIGIIGGTGSSKTTLIQLISRLYDATEGTVKVGGRDVRDYSLDVLRQAVAVVLQRNILFTGTIAENLRWGDTEATDEELAEACRLAQADEFVQRFPEGYATHIEQGGTNVSGGQKQRLCIARALLRKPKILILDDSTSAVDTKTDRLIREAFRSFIPSTTKIVIAQRTSSVEDADRIVVMRDGRIDAIGTHEELLLENDIYREVYMTQNSQSHDERMAEIEEDMAEGTEADA